jgi:hypothetical protein
VGFVSGIGLPLYCEQRETLCVVIVCLSVCLIALLARIALSGFFRTEMAFERCSLDIYKDWGDRPITRLLPRNTHTQTHTHTHTHTNTNTHTQTHTQTHTHKQLAPYWHIRHISNCTDSAQCVYGLQVRCCIFVSQVCLTYGLFNTLKTKKWNYFSPQSIAFERSKILPACPSGYDSMQMTRTEHWLKVLTKENKSIITSCSRLG